MGVRNSIVASFIALSQAVVAAQSPARVTRVTNLAKEYNILVTTGTSEKLLPPEKHAIYEEKMIKDDASAKAAAKEISKRADGVSRDLGAAWMKECTTLNSDDLYVIKNNRRCDYIDRFIERTYAVAKSGMTLAK